MTMTQAGNPEFDNMYWPHSPTPGASGPRAPSGPPALSARIRFGTPGPAR